MTIPNILVPMINVQTNTFDALLTGLGLRFMQLAKTSEEFQELLDNRTFTIQIASEEGVARHYKVSNGTFVQHYGFATTADMTMTFIDNETGVSILTKGEPTAFMVAVQAQELKIEGDYSLMMWFGKAANFVVPPIPDVAKDAFEHTKPMVQQAKNYVEMAVPAFNQAIDKLKSMKK